MKKAVITGASGFLGQNLCKHLINKEYQILILVRETSNIEFTKDFDSKLFKIKKFRNNNFDDIYDTIIDFKPDIGFHLAAAFDKGQTNREIHNLNNVNILYGMILLNALVESGCKNFISIGTSWQNFSDEEYNPVNLYAATKEAFQAIIKYYEKTKMLNTIILKLCDTYGKNDRRKKIINFLKEAYQNDKALDMTKGEQYLSLTYIDDIVEGLLLAAEYIMNGEHCGKTFFVANKELIKLKDLVKTIEKIGNKKLKINWGSVPYREREIMKPYIGELLPNWEAKVSIKKGIEKVLNERNLI